MLSWHIERVWAVVYLGRTAGRATRSKWIYSQGVYFEPTVGGELRISGFILINKKTNQKCRINAYNVPLIVDGVSCGSVRRGRGGNRRV